MHHETRIQSRHWRGIGLVVVFALLALTVTQFRTASVVAQDEEADGQALVRVIHLSPNAPNVDIFVDDQPVVRGLVYGQATAYLTVSDGDRNIKVTAEGGNLEDAVIDTDVTLEDGRTYEVGAVNLLDDIQAEVWEVDRSPIGDPTTARVRVIHAVPGQDAVDVGVLGGNLLVEGVEFPSASEFVGVPAGTYDFEVRPSGETAVAIAADGVEIEANLIYDLIAVGQGTDLQVLALTTEPAPNCATVLGLDAGGACVRVIHASPGAPNVDVYVGDAAEPSVSDLAFGEATDFVSVPGGEVQIRVTAAGASVDDAVLDETVDLGAGRAYHVAAANVLDDIQAEIDEVDLSGLGEGQARLRVHHASPDAGGVNITVPGVGPLVENLEFPDTSTYAPLDAGSYDLEVRNDDDEVILSQTGVELEAGMVYDVYAIGQTDDQTLQLLTLSAPTATGGVDTTPPDAEPTATPTPAGEEGTVPASPPSTPESETIQVTTTPQTITVTVTPTPTA